MLIAKIGGSFGNSFHNNAVQNINFAQFHFDMFLPSECECDQKTKILNRVFWLH
jgi:hypothetical protein